MEARSKTITTNEDFKLISDPYRIKILDTMASFGQSMTVKMIATEMNEVPAKVHYHVKKLVAGDILKLDYTENINGITAKYYEIYYSQFKIDIGEAENDAMKQIQIDNVTKLVIDKINDFKTDFVNRSEEVRSMSKEEAKTDGFISKTTLYLNEHELQEFQDLFSKFSDNHIKKSDDKKKYSMLIGLIRKK